MVRPEEASATRATLDAVGFTQMIERSIAEFEPLAELEKKLPSVLSGQARPASTAEALAFARLCSAKQLHGASARFWAAAFRSDRTLADDAGRITATKPHARPHWAARARAKRSRSLIWPLESSCGGGPGLAQGRTCGLGRECRQRRSRWRLLEAAQTLTSWKADGDLAGVRDPDALARLPEAERKDWQALWADVEVILTRASRASAAAKGRPRRGHS